MPPTPAVTAEDVDRKDPPEQVGPLAGTHRTHASDGRGCSRPARCTARPGRVHGTSTAAHIRPVVVGFLRRVGDDAIPVGRRGRQQPVVREQVDTWLGDQRGEPRDEGHRIEFDRRGTTRPILRKRRQGPRYAKLGAACSGRARPKSRRVDRRPALAGALVHGSPRSWSVAMSGWFSSRSRRTSTDQDRSFGSVCCKRSAPPSSALSSAELVADPR